MTSTPQGEGLSRFLWRQYKSLHTKRRNNGGRGVKNVWRHLDNYFDNRVSFNDNKIIAAFANWPIYQLFFISTVTDKSVSVIWNEIMLMLNLKVTIFFRIWKLKIRQVQESDRGCYMCQLNTAEMKKQIGCIDVLSKHIFFL